MWETGANITTIELTKGRKQISKEPTFLETRTNVFSFENKRHINLQLRALISPSKHQVQNFSCFWIPMNLETRINQINKTFIKIKPNSIRSWKDEPILTLRGSTVPDSRSTEDPEPARIWSENVVEQKNSGCTDFSMP